jgi:hypothetical protein
MKGITKKLSNHVAAFPHFTDLHPFEKSLMNLSVGEINYSRIIGNLHKLRKAVNQVLPLQVTSQGLEAQGLSALKMHHCAAVVQTVSPMCIMTGCANSRKENNEILHMNTHWFHIQGMFVLVAHLF